MLWIVGVIVLLTIGIASIVVGIYFLKKDEIEGALFILLGAALLFFSYQLTYANGHGITAQPSDLNKRIIYIFEGKIETGQNEAVAILKDAKGTIICIKTSAVLPPGTDYVKRAKLTDDKVELVSVTKASEKTPKE